MEQTHRQINTQTDSVNYRLNWPICLLKENWNCKVSCQKLQTFYTVSLQNTVLLYEPNWVSTLWNIVGKDLGGLMVHSWRHITNTQWTEIVTAEQFSAADMMGYCGVWSVYVRKPGK